MAQLVVLQAKSVATGEDQMTAVGRETRRPVLEVAVAEHLMLIGAVKVHQPELRGPFGGISTNTICLPSNDQD